MLAFSNGSLGVYNSYADSITLGSLNYVGGTLSIGSNRDLANISLPALRNIGGGLEISNTTLVDNIELPVLQTVGGTLDCYGSFTKYDNRCPFLDRHALLTPYLYSVSFPALLSVSGEVNI